MRIIDSKYLKVTAYDESRDACTDWACENIVAVPTGYANQRASN